MNEGLDKIMKALDAKMFSGLETAVLCVALIFVTVLVVIGMQPMQFCPVDNHGNYCKNGWTLNRQCSEGIYGYECTDDGQNVTYMCRVPQILRE